MPAYRSVDLRVSVLRCARLLLRCVHVRLVRVSLHVRLGVALAVAVRRVVNNDAVVRRGFVRRVDHEVGWCGAEVPQGHGAPRSAPRGVALGVAAPFTRRQNLGLAEARRNQLTRARVHPRGYVYTRAWCY